MSTQSNTTSLALIGTVPRGPRPVYAETAESIASARAYLASERARVELQGVVFRDADGTGALTAVLRGER